MNEKKRGMMVELNRDLESVTVLLQLLVVLLAPVILLKIRNVKHKIVQKLLPQSQEHEQLQQLQLFQQLQQLLQLLLHLELQIQLKQQRQVKRIKSIYVTDETVTLYLRIDSH